MNLATSVVLERQDSERIDLSFTCPTATVCKGRSTTRTNCAARTGRVAASTTTSPGLKLRKYSVSVIALYGLGDVKCY